MTLPLLLMMMIIDKIQSNSIINDSAIRKEKKRK